MNEKARVKIHFEQNENTKRAVEAMRITHKNGPFWLSDGFIGLM